MEWIQQTTKKKKKFPVDISSAFSMLMINITILMITFVYSTISKSTSPPNYSSTVIY